MSISEKNIFNFHRENFLLIYLNSNGPQVFRYRLGIYLRNLTLSDLIGIATYMDEALKNIDEDKEISEIYDLQKQTHAQLHETIVKNSLILDHILKNNIQL